MPSPQMIMDRVVRRLGSHTSLSESDRDALLALPFKLRSLDAGSYIIREGEPPVQCSVVMSGFAYRHKVTGDGARQIVSIHMPGDFLDLQNMFLGISDHNVQTLTRAEVAFVPHAALEAVALAHPTLGMAMWVDTLIDASIFREWVVNVGRRDSRTRIAHLLCEFSRRLEYAGLSEEYSYDLPMTQEQLADAVGLTPVHVNRVLKMLGREGLISRERRHMTIPDWDRLRSVGDFSERYLHLAQKPEGGSIRVNLQQ